MSVADPAFTVPFLLFLVLASLVIHNLRLRKILNWSGIIFGLSYLSMSFYNKAKVNKIFETSLAEQGIEYNRHLITPTILNNILWNCIAEGDTVYHQGFYSLFDKKPLVKDIMTIPKLRHNSLKFENQREFELLKWFSSGYYNVQPRNEVGKWQYNDLRFGSLRNSSDLDPKQDFIFSFILQETPHGVIVRENDEIPEERSEMAKGFFKRIMGE